MQREHLLNQAALLQRAVHAACPEAVASRCNIVPGSVMNKEAALAHALNTIEQSLFLWNQCESTSAFFMGAALGLMMAHDVHIVTDAKMEFLVNSRANVLPV